ncbi:UDP-N-acetylmuramoylalanyl-D-glutamate--2,6-diaminopimelate ligase [Plesiocystis pacifica SIR-1]|uniref:UDP-N-acetylmuramoylalanyl-D-glutamate--2, 6-diaminopimelate ligase n=1 Tax=Plesiocystis pacifica SIR-1 TaxID=391625 RepID=A6GER5_9BACT|nr:UDP-N-acetylmuramyl-tripeptide synthetase [Plesiocystis pacifica]EDM75648.1 UDP-N-acetylmuramoylalanyl-D-glutamate--2,6-diaminopimelate ligase [Plesiocystis pacifica SIR-1]
MHNPYPPPPSWAEDIVSVGVTGTDGKTSTTRFLAAAMARAGGGPTARVTTVDASILRCDPDGSAPLREHGGPPPENHRAFLRHLGQLRDEPGPRFAAIEATSTTLAIGFATAWPFRVGVFTNLGHDHLRAHGSYEHYLASKAQLFLSLPPGGFAVLNADDPTHALVAEVLPEGVQALWFAGPGRAEDRPVDLRLSTLPSSPGEPPEPRSAWTGQRLRVDCSLPAGSALPSTLTLRALPRFQTENAAAALLAALALGLPAAPAAAAIAECEPPVGRFELLALPELDAEARARLPRVVIDYAHTPEALELVLRCARELHPGRCFVVFGAGGSADPSKRAPLGLAASVADRIFVTTDNPRDEDPSDIARQVCAGIPAGHPHVVELDRGQAIALAIAEAQPGDLVIVAGKGHERDQIRGKERTPFSDHDAARAALLARARG